MTMADRKFDPGSTTATIQMSEHLDGRGGIPAIQVSEHAAAGIIHLHMRLVCKL